MGGIKLSVHPLFFLFGLYYAAVGRIFEFAAYTVTAVIHELGHSFAAASFGYRLDRIILMPFGAVVKGNIDGLKLKDEIKIAIAGPAVNLGVGILFVALWWLFPETYAFTDVAAQANLSMAAINLAPAFPLDGGRVLSAIISIKKGKAAAVGVCTAAGIVLSAVLFALFALSFFRTPNFSILLFSIFVLSGALSRAKDNVYIKAYSAVTEERLSRGMAVKRQAIAYDASVKKMLSLADETAVNEFVVYDKGKPLGVISQEKIEKIIETGNIYEKVGKYLAQS